MCWAQTVIFYLYRPTTINNPPLKAASGGPISAIGTILIVVIFSSSTFLSTILIVSKIHICWYYLNSFKNQKIQYFSSVFFRFFEGLKLSKISRCARCVHCKKSSSARHRRDSSFHFTHWNPHFEGPKLSKISRCARYLHCKSQNFRATIIHQKSTFEWNYQKRKM